MTTGPKTKELERKLAEYVGVNKVVCLNSATAALEMALRILGIGSGDEVITCAYTYAASASVIEHVGAKIVPVDCQADSAKLERHEGMLERRRECTKKYDAALRPLVVQTLEHFNKDRT